MSEQPSLFSAFALHSQTALAVLPNRAEVLAQLPPALESWFPSVARSLPWRNTHDPYAIWVSEVMLQQTQVSTVLPYYQRFMEALPTVAALAQAEEAVVLKLWEGLGYYSRARNLQKAAKVVVNEHQGQWPTTKQGWLQLPGVGDYTAGAILSFAFKQRQPLVDGNVKRVLARLCDEDRDIKSTEADKQFWAWATELSETCTDIWTFNQAIMELGATVCTPANPSCGVCPVNHTCLALASNTVDQRPVVVAKAPVPHKHIGVAVIQNAEGHYFVQQRPAEGLLAGLWEFPGGKQEANEPLELTVRREIKEELGWDVAVERHLLNVSHAYSHFKVTLHVYQCLLGDDAPEPVLRAAQAARWLPLSELRFLPFPKANIKILDFLEAQV